MSRNGKVSMRPSPPGETTEASLRSLRPAARFLLLAQTPYANWDQKRETALSDDAPTTHKTYGDIGFTEALDEAFATLQSTQMELSHMADSKANIMITVCSIMLTLVVAQLQGGSLLIPSVIFAIFSALALFFAILCVMPSVAPPKLDPSTARVPKPLNLLFFMN